MSDRFHRLTSDGDTEQKPAAAPEYPRYVRWLAVFYGLTLILGPIGFYGLIFTAVWLWNRNGLQLNNTIVVLAISALACPLLCQLYRWLFVQWGRWRWPPLDEPIDE